MRKTIGATIALMLLGCCLAACNNDSSVTPAPGEPGAGGGGAPGSSTAGGYMSQPKSSLTHQLELLKAGDTEKLKACFTERVRGDVTPELVEKEKEKAGKATIDDLYASDEPGEDGGNKTVKVKMKNGRTLTTLVQTNGQWLSDTVWFK